jgi:hypothetical protein
MLDMSAELGGRSVFVAPSTYVQAQLEFGEEEVQLSTEPPGFAVYALLDGGAGLARPAGAVVVARAHLCLCFFS